MCIVVCAVCSRNSFICFIFRGWQLFFCKVGFQICLMSIWREKGCQHLLTLNLNLKRKGLYWILQKEILFHWNLNENVLDLVFISFFLRNNRKHLILVCCGVLGKYEIKVIESYSDQITFKSSNYVFTSHNWHFYW